MIFELKLFGFQVFEFSWVRAELASDDDSVTLGMETERAEEDGEPFGFALP